MAKQAVVSVRNTGNVPTTFYYAITYGRNPGGSDCGTYVTDVDWDMPVAQWYSSMTPVAPGATETITISGLPDPTYTDQVCVIKIRTSASSTEDNCLDGAYAAIPITQTQSAEITSFAIN